MASTPHIYYSTDDQNDNPNMVTNNNVVHVFACADVERFPSLEKERERMERERAESGERRTPGRLHDPNHNRESIFEMPSMELFFKTEHLQAPKSPESSGEFE